VKGTALPAYDVRLFLEIEAKNIHCVFTKDIRLPFVPHAGLMLSGIFDSGSEFTIGDVYWNMADHRFDVYHADQDLARDDMTFYWAGILAGDGFRICGEHHPISWLEGQARDHGKIVPMGP
jgi:hypothetical protein